MSTTNLVILVFGAALAGWIDALVGGGGLLLIPLLLIFAPSLTIPQSLATNKSAAICGTTMSAVVLYRNVPAAKKALKFVPLALLGAIGGAMIATHLSAAIMRPLVIILLVAVGLFLTFSPKFGQNGGPIRNITVRGAVLLSIFVLVIGVYDGAFGPGTGVFFIISCSAILGSDFVTSAAWAKILNVSTNFGALCAFIIAGQIVWKLAIMLAFANVIGGYLGARTVLWAGAKFLRYALIMVVLVMALKLGYDQFGASL